MWRIKQIFDGEYGCEELLPGQKPKVSVTLVNEAGEERIVSAEDCWLTEQGLDVGGFWPEESVHRGRYNEPGREGADVYDIVQKAREHMRSVEFP